MITETWLKRRDGAVRAACRPKGYIFLDQPRSSDRMGGGTASCPEIL